MSVTLYDFYADWCGPCKQMDPIIDELEEEGYNVERVDVDEHQDVANEYQVRALPTFVVEKDGDVVERLVGVQSKDELVSVLDNA